jgi:hypothetical protein
MSALSAFDSVLPVFDALSFFDRLAVLAIVSSSAFRCRSVQRPTEARFQLRDEGLNATIDHKIRERGLRTHKAECHGCQQASALRFGLELPLSAQPMVELASVRAAFIDPNEVSALPDPILVDPLRGCADGNVSRDAWIRFARRFAGH